MRLATVVYIVSGLILLYMRYSEGYVYDSEEAADLPDDSIEETKRKVLVVEKPGCNDARSRKLMRTKNQRKKERERQRERQKEREREKQTENEVETEKNTRLNDDSSFNWQMYLLKRRRPWLMLPNTMCYRQRCETSKDCCRQNNICDKSAKVCYDCWYGYPCKTSAQCCQRYPRCVKSITGDGRCGK